MSTGAVSNALTAFAKSLESRTLPDSVVAFVKSQLETGENSVDRRDASQVVETAVQEAAVLQEPEGGRNQTL